jgi:hypothetical protein
MPLDVITWAARVSSDSFDVAAALQERRNAAVTCRSSSARSCAARTARSAAKDAAIPKGDHTLTWDGLSDSGSPAADGAYTLAISYTDAAGNNGTGETEISVDSTARSGRCVVARHAFEHSWPSRWGLRQVQRSQDGVAQHRWSRAPNATAGPDEVHVHPEGWMIGSHGSRRRARDRPFASLSAETGCGVLRKLTARAGSLAVKIRYLSYMWGEIPPLRDRVAFTSRLVPRSSLRPSFASLTVWRRCV